MSNHLGNVLAVVSDVLLPSSGGVGGGLDDAPIVVSATDYYAFGQEMVGRTYASEDYRYGFNGKENDREWGESLIQDYGMRLYNPALCRFLSVDPLTPEYPWYTPYQFAGNMPIKFIDLDGTEPYDPSVKNLENTLLITSATHAMTAKSIEASKNYTFKHLWNTCHGYGNNRYRSLIGAAGEGHAADLFRQQYSLDGAATSRITFWILFNNNQVKGSTERWDFKFAMTRLKNNTKWTKGLTMRFCDSNGDRYSRSFLGLGGGGSPKYNLKIDFDRSNTVELLFEVKTLSEDGKNTATNIDKGFDQAIYTAGKEDGVTKISILILDEDAYLNARKNPLNAVLFDKKHAELTQKGGYLHLVPNLTKNANRIAKEVYDAVKSGTTNEKNHP